VAESLLTNSKMRVLGLKNCTRDCLKHLQDTAPQVKYEVECFVKQKQVPKEELIET